MIRLISRCEQCIHDERGELSFSNAVILPSLEWAFSRSLLVAVIVFADMSMWWVAWVLAMAAVELWYTARQYRAAANVVRLEDERAAMLAEIDTVGEE